MYASEGPELIQYDLDSTVPALVRRSATTLPAVVQAGCRHSTMERLYIVSSNAGYAANFTPSDEHFLSAFEITGTGGLAPIGETVSLPHRPVDVTIDHVNSHLLVAYSDPAGIPIHPGLDDGTISDDRESPKLGLRNYSHQVMVSPDDEFVTVSVPAKSSTATRTLLNFAALSTRSPTRMAESVRFCEPHHPTAASISHHGTSSSIRLFHLPTFLSSATTSSTCIATISPGSRPSLSIG